jgi:hypothetical protein
MVSALMLYNMADVSDVSGYLCLLLAALVLVTLDNCEGARVLVVLHHEPGRHVSSPLLHLFEVKAATHQPWHSLSLL